MKKWIAIAVAALVVVAGVYFGSAYFAANNLKNAAISGDAEKLEAAVDFPAVRESLKGQLTAALMEKFESDPEMKGNPFAGMAMAFAPAMVNQMVDGFVTPHGIAAMVKGNKPGETQKATNPSINYEHQWVDSDRFRVKVTNKEKSNDPALSLMFGRRGFATWKLTKIEIPKEVFNQ